MATSILKSPNGKHAEVLEEFMAALIFLRVLSWCPRIQASVDSRKEQIYTSFDKIFLWRGYLTGDT